MEVDFVGGPEDGGKMTIAHKLDEGFEFVMQESGAKYYLHYEKSGRARLVYFKVSLEM